MTDPQSSKQGRRTLLAEVNATGTAYEVPVATGWAQEAATSNEGAEAGIDFTRYLDALRKRCWLAVIIALPVSALAAGAIWKYLPKAYTTASVLQLASTERQLIFQTADSSSPVSNAFDMYKRTQKQLLRSRFVIVHALRDDKLKTLSVLKDEPDPVAWLEKKLIVNFPDDAEVLSISLTAETPDGLDLILNSVVDSYFHEVVYVERQRKQDRLNNLELAYNRFETEWRTKQTELTVFTERAGAVQPADLSLKQRKAIEKYSSIRQKLQSVQIELMELDVAGDEAAHEGEPESEALAQYLDRVLRSDSEWAQLRADREQAQGLIRSTKQAVKKKDVLASQLEPLQRRINELDRKLDARKEALRRELVNHYRQSNLNLKATHRRNVELLKAQEQRLESEAQALEASIGDSKSSTDVELMRIKAAGLQDVVSKLAAEIERTKVELRADSLEEDSPRVKVLSRALPAVNADAKSRLTKAAGAGLLGLLLPMLILVWLEARVDHIDSAGELGRALGLSVIGHVPLIPRKVMRRLSHSSKKHRQWRMRLSESVDAIAAVLLLEKKTRNMRVIMVSSATAGEGKTTLSANLATSMASAGFRTCLVDFDLRRPALHRVFDLAFTPGVYDVLRNPDEFASVIQETQIPNLSFLPAGMCATKGLSELTAPAMESLFIRLRSSFDFVVIDGSPILPVVDTRVIAQHVDAMILSVLRDVSRMRQIRKACEVLDSFSVPICGVVVTGSRGEAYPRSYYESMSLPEAG